MSEGLPGSAAEPGTLAGSLTDRVDEYRRTRGEVERGVLPLATSVDGRQSPLRPSLHALLVQTGGYVALEGDGQPRLGQVLTMRPASVSATDAGLDRTKSDRKSVGWGKRGELGGG